MDKLLEMRQFLEQLSTELNSQDNMITAHPLYCVFQVERIYGMDKSLDIDRVFVDEECIELSRQDLMDAFDLTERQIEDGDLPDTITETGYVDRPRFVNAHLTLEAANKYIRENNHNLNRPYVYVASMNRCPEMIQLRELLMSGDLIEAIGELQKKREGKG